MSLLLTAVGIPYLVPTGVAAYRKHPNATAIILVNLLLGWTVIGWVAALIWACTGRAEVQPVAAPGDEAGPDGLRLQGRDPRFDNALKPGPSVHPRQVPP